MPAVRKIVAIVNQKGGVGKSTTAINLAAYLAGKGERILVADMDPQGNATSGLGVTPGPGGCMYDVLLEGKPLQEVAVETEIEGLLSEFKRSGASWPVRRTTRFATPGGRRYS